MHGLHISFMETPNVLELYGMYVLPLHHIIKMKNRLAFKMKLKPGCADEYKKRHDAIWPELKKLLTESGICDYAIFLDEETNILFAVQTLAGANSSQQLGTNPIVQKWWAYMSDIMETEPDQSPVSKPLRSVFLME